jgi:transcriptional regulator
MFQPSEAQIDDLVCAFPFASMVSAHGDSFLATPLPFLLERNGRQATLFGHFARSNPHVEAIAKRPDAIVIFLGPHGYISPSWFSDRTQAPTWNYAIVQFNVRIKLMDSPQEAKEAVERLVTAMERGRPNEWRSADMGDRYERLIPHVVAFSADVLSTNAKFKLGQNERYTELVEEIRALECEGRSELVRAMQFANADRLERSLEVATD